MNPFNQREASVASAVFPPRSLSAERGDGSGNEFNISAADSCTLIVVPVKQIEHFQ